MSASASSFLAAPEAGSSAPPGKLSRTEFRRQKDLEEDRKAGRAPAEVDEDGNIINPHVPSYMAQAPWYMDTGSRSLKHQKKPVDPNAVKAGINDWYHRGTASTSSFPLASSAKKFRKGACENCGSMSHKTKDCLERPRKKGAKKLGKTLAGDHLVEELHGLDYAAKRDRWNGYDPSEHKKVIEEFEAIEQERRRLKEEQIDNATSSDLKHAKKLAQKSKSKSKSGDQDALDFSSSDSDDSDEDKYADKADAVGQKVDTDKRMTIRNLRIREDRAKYLYNLNVDSAYYDPKTRTMREAPNPDIRPEDAEYAGDNFARAQASESGALANLQLFSWQAEARGNDLNLQANPTANEHQYREFQQRKEKLRQQTKGSILDKYGGAEHFDALPKELLTGQTEQYVEYNQAGKVVKGPEKIVSKSKWEEGVLENNHTKVWGSWYDLGTAEWGYTSRKDIGHGDVDSRLDKTKLEAAILEEKAKRDPRLAAQLEQEKKRKFDALPDWIKDAEMVNRKVNRVGGKEVDDYVTEEQLEAYRLVNRAGGTAGEVSEDPMANYRDDEQL
uniref:Pre-mRNA-splicing factor SLU7 n=1 Tax=Melanopsichium pennsylvanicum 4 TaxID=1398559 RepID=A0A077R8G9_9BASI|nr:related to step II splicing factor SLU7 [Melanopsichium pennsylvanicum 4]